MRQHIFAHRRLAAALLALALLMKLLVPAGFMPDVSAGRVGIAFCPGYAATPMAAVMPGMHHDGSGDRQHGKAESPCAYASLTIAGLAGADPILLVLALAFAMVAALRAAPSVRLARTDHLRPPLRGPPRTA